MLPVTSTEKFYFSSHKVCRIWFVLGMSAVLIMRQQTRTYTTHAVATNVSITYGCAGSCAPRERRTTARRQREGAVPTQHFRSGQHNNPDPVPPPLAAV